MGSLPLISVIMPVHNGERYLAEAMDSILAQTLGDFELVIVNDGSSDGSRALLERYAAADRRVRVLHQEKKGLVGALNDCVGAATGKYLARMDCDDIALPNRFERQAAHLEAHEDCVLLGSRVLLVDPEGAPIREMSFEQTHEEIDRAMLNGWLGSPLVHPSVMMRRAAVERVGPYRKAYELSEDIDLFLRLAEVGRVASLAEVLLKYRLHRSSAGHARRQLQVQHATDAVREAYRRRGIEAQAPAEPAPVSEAEADRESTPVGYHRRLAWWALGAGYVATARKHAMKSLRHAPWAPASWRVMACAVRGH